MMTQFLADLDLNCENKKKDWAAYMKMEVTEDLFVFSGHVCPRTFVEQTVRSALHFRFFALSIHCTFDCNMLTKFLASNCYDFELGDLNFHSIVELHFQFVFEVWSIGSRLV